MTKKEEFSYGSIPTAEAVLEEEVPMVQVIAPAHMTEGFKFRAVYDGVQFPVVVPAGGCQKGQVLTVPFNPKASELPTHAWKDDIFDCTKYGILHPSFLTACCCPLILLGQIMTRLKLDWLARDATESQWKQTYMTMVYIAIGYFIVNMILSPTDPEAPPSPIYNLVVCVYTAFSIYVLMKVRQRVRENDRIKEERCAGCEDFLCAAFCGCCTVSQLARQTADYDLDEGVFFSPDGLPVVPDAPPVMNV